VCLLTGAGGELGTALCRGYADRYQIVAVYRHRRPRVVSQIESVVDPLDPDAALAENTHPVYAIRADLEQPGQIERVVELTLARFGAVDLLVNAAAHSVWSPVIDGGELLASLPRQFAVNVGVPLALATEVARRFWLPRDRDNRARNRNVVNVSSLAGSTVFPGRGQTVYAASKAALTQLSRHLASEFAVFGVRVNALAPNSFPSVVSADDVAAGVVALDDDPQATGRVLTVDALAEAG
jgi:NAD(P)-dependent dehydrogenase (short-subunit alcohol dehydrogenase family)